MNIKQLHYFLVVAQEHQITSAAKLLYIAQPPLSYQIKQLEKELGTQLFIRRPHGLELTGTGRAFQQYAKQIVSLANNAKEELQQEKQGIMGSIKIGVISSAGSIIPNTAMKNLAQYYPAVNFQVAEANTFQLVDQLNGDLIDLAVVRTPFNMQGLEKKSLMTDRMAAVFNPECYTLGKKPSLSELSRQPLILYRRFESMFNESFAQSGLRPFYAVRCDDARTAIRWADQGMGVALIPESIANEYAQQQIVPISYSDWKSQLLLVWKKEKKVKPLVKRLIDAI